MSEQSMTLLPPTPKWVPAIPICATKTEDYHFDSSDDEDETKSKFEYHRKDPMKWLAPGTKYKGKTYGEVMQTEEGRRYLKWWKDQKLVHNAKTTEERRKSAQKWKDNHCANIEACFDVYNKYKELKSGKKRKLTGEEKK